jgi:WD40 repeat protein
VALLAFRPDGQSLASVGADGTVRLWGVTGGTVSNGETLGQRGVQTSALAYHPDAPTLATATADGTIRLWDLATRKLIQPPFMAHPERVTALVYHQDGWTLASGGEDGSIVVWDLTNGAPLLEPFAANDTPVVSLTFDANDKLISAAGDGSVFEWDLDLVARACRIAGRNLTETEWEQHLGHSPYREICAQYLLAEEQGMAGVGPEN